MLEIELGLAACREFKCPTLSHPCIRTLNDILTFVHEDQDLFGKDTGMDLLI